MKTSVRGKTRETHVSPVVAVETSGRPEAKRTYKLLLVSSHPVPYASPIFRVMAQQPRLEIQVLYCGLRGAESAFDEEFGRDVEWDLPLLEGYPWTQVRNVSFRPGVGRFFGLFNPGIWKIVRDGHLDAMFFYPGYRYASFWIALCAAKLSHTAVIIGTDATSLQSLETAKQSRWWVRWKLAIKPLILSRIYRLASGKWAASLAGREYLRSLGVPEEQIGVIPLAVDNNWWTARSAEADRAAIRRSWGVPESAPVVLFCAKLQPWKRPQDLLRAFIKSGLRDAHLVFAGSGPLEEGLVSEARQACISDQVHFIGFQNQGALPAVYSAADLFVLPSEYDGCPAVVCEAMLCGLPVILSDRVRGRFELIEDGRTGFLYPCGDIDDLSGLLRQTMSDPVRLKTMSTAARQMMETCSPDTSVRDLIRLLDGIFHEPSKVRAAQNQSSVAMSSEKP